VKVYKQLAITEALLAGKENVFVPLVYVIVGHDAIFPGLSIFDITTEPKKSGSSTKDLK